MIAPFAQQLIFFSLAAGLIGGALCVVLLKNILHAAVALAFTMLAVAGFYFMLSAPYLAVVQIMLYAAGVTILILMTVMVTKRALKRPITQLNEQVGLGALIVFGAFFPLLVAALLTSNWATSQAAGQLKAEESIITLTQGLFTDFVVPFEIASMVLLVALVGAVVIAKEVRDE